MNIGSHERDKDLNIIVKKHNSEVKRKYDRTYYEKNKEKILAKSKENYYKNHEKVLERQRVQSRIWRVRNAKCKHCKFHCPRGKVDW
jgi:hypothetical protein